MHRADDSSGSQEPLEDQAELDWVEVGDVHEIADEASASRSAPRAQQGCVFALNAIRLAIGVLGTDEVRVVGDGVEVSGQVALLDKLDLAVEPIHVLTGLLLRDKLLEAVGDGSVKQLLVLLPRVEESRRVERTVDMGVARIGYSGRVLNGFLYRVLWDTVLSEPVAHLVVIHHPRGGLASAVGLVVVVILALLRGCGPFELVPLIVLTRAVVGVVDRYGHESKVLGKLELEVVGCPHLTVQLKRAFVLAGIRELPCMKLDQHMVASEDVDKRFDPVICLVDGNLT